MKSIAIFFKSGYLHQIKIVNPGAHTAQGGNFKIWARDNIKILQKGKKCHYLQKIKNAKNIEKYIYKCLSKKLNFIASV